MSKQKNPPLRELHFGHLDASQEAIDDPELLLGGFFDYREAAIGIDSGATWLLLGQKGSGKSAVLEHIRLSWLERYDRFFSITQLVGFPVAEIERLDGSAFPGGHAQTQLAWELILLLKVSKSILSDQSIRKFASLNRVDRDLKTLGINDGDLLKVVSSWRESRHKIDLKFYSWENVPKEWTPSINDVVQAIRKGLEEVELSNSRHVIALDGLDSFLMEAHADWTSLSALMQAVYGVNRFLRAAGLPVSVVCSMRPDIFDVLPSAENNKLKPHSCFLDWQSGGIGSKNQLWNLLTRKAAVSRPSVSSIVAQYLSRPILIGPHTEMAEFLLDNTRLLPRDAVALMGYVQKEYGGSGDLPQNAAKDAVHRYAEEYFVGEIFDNLGGVLPSSSARFLSSFQDALRTAPTRRFDFDYLKEELVGELEPVQIKSLLKRMFEVGGIGIVNGNYTDFVFRKVGGAGFTTRAEFILHDALTRAWNRPWR